MNEQYASVCQELPDYLAPIQSALTVFVRDARRRVLLEQVISRALVEAEYAALTKGIEVTNGH